MAEPDRTPDGRYIVVGGRKWRASDPELPDDLRAPLLSQLGKARSAVKVAGDDDALAEARARVQWAKEGLGERGEPWWELSVDARLKRARDRLSRVDGSTDR